MAERDDPHEPGEPDALEREYVVRQEAHARKVVEYFSDRNKPQRERARPDPEPQVRLPRRKATDCN